MMKRVYLLAAVLVVAFGLSGCSYNSLTAQQQQVKGAWADVESQLQRRADLIPNMIKTANLSAVQEQEVFGQISEARSRLLNATQAAPQGADGDKTPEQKEAVINAANSFGGTVGRLLSIQEAYPTLGSNTLFLKAQDELSGTENRIATKREDYNKTVVTYNTARNQFPAVITASLMGFKEEPVFKADPSAMQAPQIPDANTLRRNGN